MAVHILTPNFRKDSHWPSALVKGAEIAAQFGHPNIVPVIDHGVHETVYYVVLRLMEGGTLLTRLKEGPVEIQQSVAIVNQIAAALDYVHSQGSCHGDPATVNIVFDSWGNAFVADFYLRGLLEVTDLAVPVGTTAFLAPERMLAQPPTALTDQYALAGVSYTMLTGKQPWDLPARARLAETIVLPQNHRPEIPIAVNSVLFRALAKDPRDRFPTIMDFARKFEHSLKNTPRHVFISYSRRDSEYVRHLKEYLNENGLQAWIDDQIEHGDQWFNNINQAIKNSAAFLIIMSPEAEQSEWVQKEILLAKRYRKPMFPLLLRGEEIPILIDLQFADVRNGEMPSPDFHRRVARSVYGL